MHLLWKDEIKVITQHIQSLHKDRKRVKNALKMKKKERVEELQRIRREGILQYNKLEASKESPNYQSERKKRKYFEIVLCSYSGAFISKRFFHVQRRFCSNRMDSPVCAIPMALTDLLSSQHLSMEFVTIVLAKMRDDVVGKSIRQDEYIMYLGHKFYQKLKHKEEKIYSVTKSARSDTRDALYLAFLSYAGITKNHENVLDMFSRENFDSLCDAVEEVITNEDKTMKTGLRQNIFFLLIKSCKKLRDRLYLEKNEI